FALTYSHIVLQQIPPEYSVRYIQEFVRTLAPDGIGMFQVPSHVARSSPPPSKDTMFSARIDASTPETIVTAGAKIQLAVTVKNTSIHLWPARSASGTV